MSEFVYAPTIIRLAETRVNVEGVEVFNRAVGCNVNIDADILEIAGRTCYSSFARLGKPRAFVKALIKNGHTSVLEHMNFTFFISGVSRSLTHQLVRHRIGASVSQRSQRYVSPEELKFVIPPLLLESGMEAELDVFFENCNSIENMYKCAIKALRDKGQDKVPANETARSILPNCTETALTWTVNGRALLHFLELRDSLTADAEIHRLAKTIRSVVSDTGIFDQG